MTFTFTADFFAPTIPDWMMMMMMMGDDNTDISKAHNLSNHQQCSRQ